MMTRANGYQALKTIYKVSTPSNAHEDFYVGYPWDDPTYNDGSRLIADYTTNAYADHSAIEEDADALRLRTIHDPKAFQYNKTRSGDCTFGAWKDNPTYPGGHSSLRDYIISLEYAIDVTFVNFQLLDIHRSDINYD